MCASQVTLIAATDSIFFSVVPFLYVPLNVSECMCRSLEDLADSTSDSIFVSSCATNQNCDGIRCEVHVLSTTNYAEIVILPCDNAVELIVEDENFQHLHTTIINETGSRYLIIGNALIRSDVVIIPGDYSMNISVSLEMKCHINAGWGTSYTVILPYWNTI